MTTLVNNTIVLRNVRLAFTKLEKAEAMPGTSNFYFGCTVIVEPGTAEDKALQEVVEAVGRAKWKDAWPAIKAKLPDDKKGYLMTPRTNAQGKVFDGFEGMHSVAASRPEDKGAPKLYDARNTYVEGGNRIPRPAAPGALYSGCIAQVQLECWAQANGFGNAIRFTLMGAMFVADGERFGGGGTSDATVFTPAEPEAVDMPATDPDEI
jgi:Protein of unknown function (DUF2815)